MVVTVLQAIDLHDTLTLGPADGLVVEGFAGDTIVRSALEALAHSAGVEPRWSVHIEKRIPVAAGLGGGSTDAAAALRLANMTLEQPLDPSALHALAADLGADVPFFLCDGPRLATSDGTRLAVADVPSDFVVVLVSPEREAKESTAAVYAAFDERDGAHGFGAREAELRRVLASVAVVGDLAALPRNDLASSPLAARLLDAGAFRADVSGAGPTVYGLFGQEADAMRAAQSLAAFGRTIVTRPVGAADPP